jgi:hypothetical protein
MYVIEQTEKVKKAIKLSEKENKKYMVLVMNGKVVIRSKQEIKQMIRKKEIRHSMQEVEKRAIYVTGAERKGGLL